MKKAFALLLCTLLVFVGVLSVAAETTTGAVSTTIPVEETEETYTEIYEVISNERSPYPRGSALAMLLLGGLLVVLAIALLCIFLFAFPRWGLVKNVSQKKKAIATEMAEELPAPTEETPEEQPEESPIATEAVEETRSEKEALIAELLEDVSPEEPTEQTESAAVKLEDLF